eukprot:239402-Rhodomonas_salina.2
MTVPPSREWEGKEGEEEGGLFCMPRTGRAQRPARGAVCRGKRQETREERRAGGMGHLDSACARQPGGAPRTTSGLQADRRACRQDKRARERERERAGEREGERGDLGMR